MGRYDPCPICGSFAKNPNNHGRIEGKYPDLCDVCYWRAEAEMLQKDRDDIRQRYEMADAYLDTVREWLARYPEYIDIDGVPAMIYPEARQAALGKRSKQLSDEIERLRNCMRQLWNYPQDVKPIFSLYDLTQDEKDRK